MHHDSQAFLYGPPVPVPQAGSGSAPTSITFNSDNVAWNVVSRTTEINVFARMTSTPNVRNFSLIQFLLGNLEKKSFHSFTALKR